VVRFEAALGRGLAAAREMWGLTRDRRVAGPNEAILRGDAARLRTWRDWLGRSLEPGRASGPAPVVGVWQLVFTVVNLAPALQKVVVERRAPGGHWEDVDGIFTIEFQAGAAAPRARRVHRLSVPLDGLPRAGELRLSVRGFGRLRLGDVLLTDGVRSLSPAPGSRRSAVLGKDAPACGYPDFDWTRNKGSWLLRFRGL
jgi:hypothetical protein